MKKKKYLLFFLPIILIILFCYKLTSINSVSNDNIVSPYLHINLFDSASSMNTFYEYDQRVQKDKILLKKDIKDYTSFTYSQKKRTLYYVDKAKDDTTQLFSTKLHSKEAKQLTKEISSVDFIQISKGQKKIFMRVLLKGEFQRNFHMATYNIDNKKLKIWDKSNEDKSILNFHYDNNTDKLLVGSFSESESNEKLEYSNEKQTPMIPPKYSLDIYDPNGKKKAHVTTVEKFINGLSLDYNHNSLLFSYDNDLNSSASSIIQVDITSGKKQTLLTSSKTHLKIRSVLFDEYGKGFYFLSSPREEGNGSLDNFKQNVISYYNLKNKQTKDIWKSNKGVIVNYSLNVY